MAVASGKLSVKTNKHPFQGMLNYVHKLSLCLSTKQFKSHIPTLSIHIPVIVHDGIESMCYGEDCALFELLSDRVLDQIVCLQVHSCCGFIQNQDLCLTEQSASQADKLSLSNTGEMERKS